MHLEDARERLNVFEEHVVHWRSARGHWKMFEEHLNVFETFVAS